MAKKQLHMMDCGFLLCTKGSSPPLPFAVADSSRLVYILCKCVFTALFVESSGNDTLITGRLHTDIYTHTHTLWLTSHTSKLNDTLQFTACLTRAELPTSALTHFQAWAHILVIQQSRSTTYEIYCTTAGETPDVLPATKDQI